MNRVFVYGTLKKGQPNHYLIEDALNGCAVFLGRAKTKSKWPLVISSPYNIPFLLDKEGTGHSIYGELYDVDSQMLEKLDELEDHPRLYVRSKVDFIRLDPSDPSQTNVNCWVYILKRFKPALLELPYLEDYDYKGGHGLEYIARYSRAEDFKLAPYVKLDSNS